MGVKKAAGPNRFRYWDLKEAGTNVPLYGFSMPIKAVSHREDGAVGVGFVVWEAVAATGM